MITVIGEALINLVLVSGDNTLRAQPGGNALVVAVRAASLGYPTALMTRFSSDHFGQSLRRYAAERGVDVTAAPEADEPTMIAVSGPGTPGTGTEGPTPGSLYFRGTASWQWNAEELRYISPDTAVLYVGSLAGCVPPGSGRILRAAARQRGRGVTVFVDLDVCPEVVGSPGRGRLLIERLIRSADVIRASIDGIGWLHPGRSPEAVACQWLDLGPKLAVISCGADGVMAVHSSGTVVHRPAHPARAVDPVGADDAFTAGLLGGLHESGPHESGRHEGLEKLSAGATAALVDSAIAAMAACATSPAAFAAAPVSAAATLAARPPLATSDR
ncbi:MAG TPA: PfkB family carbohydrate kinase [Streptosporangiaceae bacterium]|nr:PfkB family carbohydrate kinase [Streptosporangiaceae bacterium]